MDELFDKVKNALIELRTASKDCEKSEAGIRRLMDKYDMIFSGEKINTIFTVELAHTLTEKFGVPIQHEELTKIVSSLCKQLGMTYTELYPVEEMGKGVINPDHVSYHIVLY